MFVYYYVHLNRPFKTVERRLLGLLTGLDGLASSAYREGEVLRTRLGTGDGRMVLAKTVEIAVGEPLIGDSETEVPVTWKATGTPGLFPFMEAGIVVAKVGPNLTQLLLRGSYAPPLGAVGRTVDKTLFHRIAETSVKHFVDRLASSIEHNGHLERAG